MVTAQTRVTQDRRRSSRLETSLDCRFEFEGNSYEAVAIELSLKGALLASTFLPPSGSLITFTIESTHLKNPLIFEGKVKRVNGFSSPSGRKRFGIEVSSPPVDLAILVSKLLSRKSAH
jgi:hypothetical protein